MKSRCQFCVPDLFSEALMQITADCVDSLLLVPEIGSQVEAMSYGDQVWSRMFMDWKNWKDEGLTEHRNWWPDVYRAACECWGVQPDPKLLAYNTSYENMRADLKEVAL